MLLLSLIIFYISGPKWSKMRMLLSKTLDIGFYYKVIDFSKSLRYMWASRLSNFHTMVLCSAHYAIFLEF